MRTKASSAGEEQRERESQEWLQLPSTRANYAELQGWGHMPELLALLNDLGWDVSQKPLDWLKDLRMADAEDSRAVDMDAIEKRIERAAQDFLLRRPKSGNTIAEEVKKLQTKLVQELVTLRALILRLEDREREEDLHLDKTQGAKWAWRHFFVFYVLQSYAELMTLVFLVALVVGGTMGALLYIMSNLDSPPGSTAMMRQSQPGWALLWVIVLPALLFVGWLFIYDAGLLLLGQAAGACGASFARYRALVLGSTAKRPTCHWSRDRKAARIAAWLRCRWLPPGDVGKPPLVSLTKEDFEKECRRNDRWFTTWFYIFMGTGAVPVVGCEVYVHSFRSGPSSFAFFFKLGSCLWGGAMGGALLWAATTLIIYIYCDVFAGNCTEVRSEITAVETAITKYDIKPGDIASGYYEKVYRWMVLDAVLRAVSGWSLPEREHAGHTRWWNRCCRGCCWLGSAIFVVLLFILAMIMIHKLNLSEWGLSAAMLVLVLFYMVTGIWFGALVFYDNVGKHMGALFYIVISVLALVVGGIVMQGLELMPLMVGKPVPMPRVRGEVDDPWVWENTDYGQGRYPLPPYPNCLTRWGAHEELRLLDLAILSSYSYDNDSLSYAEGGDVWTNTSQAFDGDGLTATILLAQDYWTVGRLVVFRFSSSQGPSSRERRAGTTVLVVKGSSQPIDFYVDAGLWAVIAAFQAFMVIVPLLNQLPNQIFAALVKLHPLSPRAQMEGHIFKNIREVHARFKEEFKHDTFIITGHSLGGGIAIAAGGSLGIPAVGFSGPGSHFSRWRFGTSLEGAYRSALDVKPEVDVVHKFDRHDEASQYIACRKANGEYRDAATCHSIRTTVCELWRACGDHRKRSFAQMCRRLLNNTELKGQYMSRRRYFI